MANLVNGYTFDDVPTPAEAEIFEYASYDYFDMNPGYNSNIFMSYVGLYYDAAGAQSAIYVPNNSVTQY
jgi:hypothetical protein